MAASLLDLAVLLAYLAGVVAFGVWSGRRQKGAVDYMLGGRDLPWWALLLSIVATETSTVTFLSIPGFAWRHDFTWIQLATGLLLGRFLVVALLLPRYFAGAFFTAYEALQLRFGGGVRRTTSLLFVATRSLADGLRLFLTAIVLQELAGFSLPVAVGLVGLTTVFYTFAGGMRAVVWTDVVQFVIYVAGAGVALLVLISRLPQGWAELVSVGTAAGKFHAVDATLTLTDPYVLLAGVVGGMFLTFGSHGVDQLMVQRYLCARSQAEAGRALTWSGVVVLLQFAFFLLIGVGLYAFYEAFPPAVPFDRPDRVFARFILEQLPPGLLGLVLGAVFAAAMSTLSSSLNSSATAVVNDFYRPLFDPDGSSERTVAVTRCLTVVFGVVQVAVALAGQALSRTVVESVLTIAGFTTGITLGVFLLAGARRRVGPRAAFFGMVVGIVAVSLAAFATPLAWPWYTLVGSLSTLIAGLTAGRLWPEDAG